MASYRLWTGVNAQLDPKVIVSIAVEKKAEKVYLVTSKESLHDVSLSFSRLFPMSPQW